MSQVAGIFISRDHGGRLISQEHLQSEALTSTCGVFSRVHHSSFIDTEASKEIYVFNSMLWSGEGKTGSREMDISESKGSLNQVKSS